MERTLRAAHRAPRMQQPRAGRPTGEMRWRRRVVVRCNGKNPAQGAQAPFLFRAMKGFKQNHFELFGLAPGFVLEHERLEQAYREIQARVHPDRFAHAGEAERRASMQWTTRVNEAYRTLTSPVARAKYLLELNGVDVAFETNTQMPSQFLMQQMELREALETAQEGKDAAALDALRKDLTEARGGLVDELAQLLDGRRDYRAAVESVRKLMFLDKLDAEIDAAYEAIEA